MSFVSPVTPAEGGPIYPCILRFYIGQLVVSHSLRVDSENARHPPLLQSLQICLNLGYSLITLRESCNYQLPSFRLKQLNIIILFNSENRGINIIKGTGYQNGQFFFKSIPENVIKKLRSGDNEKMKKNHLV